MRRSEIWSMPKDRFEELVQKATSIADILRYFGFAITGRGHRMIKQRCIEDGIDFSHIPLGPRSNLGRNFDVPKKPLEEIMIENSTYNAGALKRRLAKECMFENKCAICGSSPVWNNKPLVMRLDHINGKRDDHRKENLRLVCPNCDSQLPTFCRGEKKLKHRCSSCDIKIDKKSKLCRKCFAKTTRRTTWPNKDILQQEIETMGYLATGHKYGVSDNAIRRWMKSKTL